jgi:hypothetical protein
MALSRGINPAREYDEMARVAMPLRQDNWGATIQLLAPANVGQALVQSQDLVDVSWADDKSRPITVTLNNPEDGIVAVAGGFPTMFDLIAELTFGTGGATSTAHCDWVRGQVLTVFAGRLRLRALWNTILGNALAGITVGAFAGIGASAGHRPAQFTNRCAALAAVPAPGVQVVPVPMLARRLFVAGTPVNVPVNIQFQTPGGGIVADYAVAGYPSLPLLIPNGSRFCQVTNAGQQIVTAELVWELDL